MPFTYDSMRAYAVPEVEQVVTPDDCMLYALSIGLGADPTDPGQLRYVYERDLAVLPTMGNVLAYPGFWLKREDTGVDWKKVLHAEQQFTVHRPLPTDATLVGTTRITGIRDRGQGKGAFVYSTREITDKATGERICTTVQNTLCRGDGGCGGDDPAPYEVRPAPDRAPDLTCDLPVAPQAALIYRLNGDRNPLHADPEVASTAGFERPILHGQCTFAVAGHAVLRSVCDYDASRIRSMQIRFTAPVFPGETLRTEMWREGAGVAFRTHALERGVQVLGNGWAEIAG